MEFNPDDIIDSMQKTRAQRKAQYNPRAGYTAHNEVVHGFTQIGRLWAALLSQHSGTQVDDVPPHLVCQMLAALKVWRAVTSPGLEDSYEDLMNYGGPLALECAYHTGLFNPFAGSKADKVNTYGDATVPKEETIDGCDTADGPATAQGVHTDPETGLAEQQRRPGGSDAWPPCRG